MNICVACPRLQSANKLVEFLSSDSLAGNFEHLVQRDSSLDAAFPGPGAQWRNFLVTYRFRCRRPGGLAEPNNNAADGATLGEVNMSLRNV